MRVLFIQQDHMSPTGPAGEAFADYGLDVQEFMVARRLVAAFLALGGSA